MTYNAGPGNTICTLESIMRYLGMEAIQTIHGPVRKLGEIAHQSELEQQAYVLGKRLGLKAK